MWLGWACLRGWYGPSGCVQVGGGMPLLQCGHSAGPCWSWLSEQERSLGHPVRTHTHDVWDAYVLRGWGLGHHSWTGCIQVVACRPVQGLLCADLLRGLVSARCRPYVSYLAERLGFLWSDWAMSCGVVCRIRVACLAGVRADWPHGLVWCLAWLT